MFMGTPRRASTIQHRVSPAREGQYGMIHPEAGSHPPERSPVRGRGTAGRPPYRAVNRAGSERTGRTYI